MQIFMSYSRVDKAFAQRLTNDLKTAGYEVWLDVQNIPHGSNWDLEVQNGLQESDVILVLLSPAASASDNVKDEWHYFIEKKRRIIPLMIQPNEVPFRLSRRQRIDFINKPYDQAFEELIGALNEKVETVEGEQAPTFPVRRLAMAWGDRYLLWNGLSPVSSGQAQVTQTTLQLVAPERLPILIPLTSINGAAIKRTPWDSHIALDFTDRNNRAQSLVLMGAERKTRALTQKEFLNALGSATGKRFEG